MVAQCVKRVVAQYVKRVVAQCVKRVVAQCVKRVGAMVFILDKVLELGQELGLTLQLPIPYNCTIMTMQCVEITVIIGEIH